MSILKLRSETTQLEQLYAASLYSANLASAQLGTAPEAVIDLAKPVDVLRDAPGYITPTGYQLRRYLHRRYQAQLREVLLVRLVSALEVFLIETLVSLFMARKDLFAKKDVVEFNYGELLGATSITHLWSRVIQKECRRLQSQGYIEIRRFYQSRIGIDFYRSQVNERAMDEMHDRRHVLVHRLGKTDSFYRHKYSSTDTALTVDEAYLLRSFRDVRLLASYIDSKVIDLAKQGRQVGIDPRSYRVRIDLIDVSESFIPMLEQTYQLCSLEREMMFSLTSKY